MPEDWIASLERLKLGMADPSNQSIRAKRWYDEPFPQAMGFLQPLDELIRGAAPRPNPQEGVEAIPFMSVADPLGLFIISKALSGALRFKGLKSSFTDVNQFLDYIEDVQEIRDMQNKSKDIPSKMWKDVADFLKKGPKK